MSEEIKPGYRTTEFWLTAIATLVSLCYASGFFGEGGQGDKVLGFLSAALSTLGYSVSRGLAKK